MTGFNQTFKACYPLDFFGKITGSSAYQQLPGVACAIFKLKAYSANYAPIYFGCPSGTVVFELAAGDDTGWCVADNLNRYWWSAPSGSHDFLTYWVQR